MDPCLTLTYRGSTCAEQRAKHGLGDPLTNADRIRAMSDEEMTERIFELYNNDTEGLSNLFCDGKAGCIVGNGDIECNDDRVKACILRWLQQPAEEA